MRPEVAGSFEMTVAGADRALDGMPPLGFLLPASSLGPVRVRGNCPQPDAGMHVMLDLVLYAKAALHSELLISVPSLALLLALCYRSKYSLTRQMKLTLSSLLPALPLPGLPALP